MTFPMHAGKHRFPSVTSPREIFDYRRQAGRPVLEQAPRGVVLLFGTYHEPYVVDTLRARPIPDTTHLYRLGRRDLGVCILPGIGGPQLATEVEELADRGTRQFVIVWLAGSLQPGVGIGSWVVCTRALRDEGTSHHYAAAARFARPSKPLTEKLLLTLRDRRMKAVKGATWTTDAPYRETRPEILRYRKEGILTVEMEAATLFVLGRYRKFEAAALFCVSDMVDPEGWKPRFGHARERLKEGVGIALEALSNSPR